MRTPNTSCDIYITATPGIDAPDISNVPCWIGGQFDTGAGLAGSRRYSAMLEAPLDCGLRAFLSKRGTEQPVNPVT